MTWVTADPFPVGALAALFDDGLAAPGSGDPLPPYWHLAACALPSATGELGKDGHPLRGAYPAPPGLPRRMFAGGRLQVHGLVRVGDRLDRATRVTGRADKQGRSGPLCLVTVQHELRRPDGDVLLTEEQDIAYRPAAQAGERQDGTAQPPGSVAPVPLLTRGQIRLHGIFLADPVALHRFSAATSNAHRIHYDYPHATRAEGYPGLVVHGPLLLLAMLELIRLDLPDRSVAAVTFRARAPIFAGQRARISGCPPAPGGPGADVVRVTADHEDGRTVMTCDVAMHPASGRKR